MKFEVVLLNRAEDIGDRSLLPLRRNLWKNMLVGNSFLSLQTIQLPAQISDHFVNNNLYFTSQIQYRPYSI